MSCPGPNKLNPLCLVQDSANDVAAGAATSAFANIAGFFAKAANGATKWLWEEINAATTLDLTSPKLLQEMAMTGAIAAVLCVGLFAIQLIRAILRQESGGLQRALSGLVTATLGTALALAATRILLAAVDALSAGVVQVTMETNITGLGNKLQVVNTAAPANPAIVLLLSFLTLAAVVIVWAAMLARKLMIIVAAVLAPIAFSGAVADFSKAWVRRWIEFMVAMIASKLLLVLILSIGVFILEGAGQTGGGATQGITQVVGGALILLLGGLAPWASVKMFSFAGESLHAAHAAAAQTGAGARSVVAAPQKVAAIQATSRALLPAAATAATGGAGATAAVAMQAKQSLQRRPGPLENAPHPGDQTGSHHRGSTSRSAGAVESRGPAAASATKNATAPAELNHSGTPRPGSGNGGSPTGTTHPGTSPGPTRQGPHKPPPKR